MSHPFKRRQWPALARLVAWSSSASLTCLAGCVEAPVPPAPTAAISPEDAAPSETPEVTVAATEPTPVEDIGPTLAEPTPALDDDGWVASPRPKTTIERQPTLAGGVAISEPTPALTMPPEPTPALTPTPTEAEPTPTVATSSPSLIPSGLGSVSPGPTTAEPASPAPFLVAVEPTPTETASAPAPNQQPVVAQAGTPALNANASSAVKPLDVVKPRALIHISPRVLPPPPQSDSPSIEAETKQTTSTQPAVMLPASPAASAASLAPLPPLMPSPDTKPATVEATPALASREQKPLLPTAPTLPAPSSQPPEPSKPAHGIPVTPISISKPESLPPEIIAPPAGFVALFNQQDLAGWEVFDGKSESWKFKDGLVSCVAPGGGWLQTQAMYSDFELQFEYRLSPGGNSGVALRFPGQGNPSLQGLEIQLLDDRAEKYQTIQPQQATGSLYFAAAPQVRDAAHVAGEWNQCAVRCFGQQLQVTINDQLVNEIDLSQLGPKDGGAIKPVSAVRSPMGSIALQSHSTRVDFRHVNLRDLTQAMTSGVRWLDLKEGTGESVPVDAKVTVHYVGHLSTGKRFANSFEKGKPATVLLKDVIPGWREGIPGMKVGGRRRLIVPADMAYGVKGFKEVVPPNSTLVYEVELTAFEKPAPLPPATASTEASNSAETK